MTAATWWLWMRLMSWWWQWWHGDTVQVSAAIDAAAPHFQPAPPRRRGGRPKPPWVREWVFRRYEEGIHSPRTLAAEFDREFAACTGMTVRKSTVHDWIVAHRAQALA